MRSIESTGRSIDEAIFHGLQQLEISIDGVEIEILQQESKGILGIGARPAKVRLTEREPEEVIMPDYLKEQPRPNRDRPRRDRPERPRRERGDRNEREARMEREAQLERENRGERPLRRERTFRRERDFRAAQPVREERLRLVLGTVRGRALQRGIEDEQHNAPRNSRHRDQQQDDNLYRHGKPPRFVQTPFPL